MSLLFLVSALGLAIIWIGYPLVIGAIAGLRDRHVGLPRRSGDGVSLILATREDAVAVRARVANLLDTSFPAERVEVVVGIDAARPHTSLDEWSRCLDSRVKIVEGDAPGGKAATLNAAVRCASREILVFADTAQSFDRSAVDELVQALSDPKVGAVSGMLDFPRERGATTIADAYWRYERWLRNAEARVRSAVGVTGAIYALRRRLWEPLPNGLILDDVYVPMRLAMSGWRIGFTERAIAIESRRFTAEQEHRRKVRTLTGIFQLCAWMPQLLDPRQNPLWIQFVCHKLLRLLTPYLVAACLLAICWRMVAAVVSAGAWSLLLGVVAVGCGTLAIPRFRRAVRAQVAWALALQASIVVATINGIRGRWDVWQA